MKDAWREHVGKLTLQQIHSPDACREHLHSFPRSVVSQGLALTQLASNDDVQDVITTFLRSPDYMVPPAASMKVLADTVRAFHIGVTLEEIGGLVKDAAQDGRKCITLYGLGGEAEEEFANSHEAEMHDYLQFLKQTHGLVHEIRSRRSFMSETSWRNKLCAVLEQQGYNVTNLGCRFDPVRINWY